MKTKTIGILGGGQLGKMMAMSAKQMGHKIVVLDPSHNCPCSQVADEHIISAYDSEEHIKELGSKTDLITYEFENIPYNVIKKFEKECNIISGHLPLYLSQNRIREKTTIKELNISTPKFSSIKNFQELLSEVKNIKFPCVLKTSEGGYDGKGQVVLRNDNDLVKAKQLLTVECIIEEFIDFDKEISILGTRSITGEFSYFSSPENIHKEGILHISISPSSISTEIETKASKILKKIMTELNIVGTLCIELFVVGNELYFNEMAPRPHNSYHFTLEGCNTSQFEQHIRAILGYKLGNTDIIRNTIMLNLLGQNISKLSDFLKSSYNENAYLHLYGKEEAKKDRKMGHITFVNKTYEDVQKIYEEYFKEVK